MAAGRRYDPRDGCSASHASTAEGAHAPAWSSARRSLLFRPRPPEGVVMVDVQAAMDEAATVRKATLGDVPRVAEILAGAFYDDPAFTWVLHGDPRRMDTLQRGFELFLRKLWMGQDVTYTTGGLVAAVVWELPDQWRVGSQSSCDCSRIRSHLRPPRPPRPARSEKARLKSPRGVSLLPPVHRRRAGLARARSRRRGDGARPRPLRPGAHAGIPRRHNPPQPGALRAARLHDHRRFILGKGSPPLWRMWRPPRAN